MFYPTKNNKIGPNVVTCSYLNILSKLPINKIVDLKQTSMYYNNRARAMDF